MLSDIGAKLPPKSESFSEIISTMKYVDVTIVVSLAIIVSR